MKPTKRSLTMVPLPGRDSPTTVTVGAPLNVVAYFADGSVHLLAETIDYMTYQRLGCRRDGEPVGTFEP